MWQKIEEMKIENTNRNTNTDKDTNMNANTNTNTNTSTKSNTHTNTNTNGIQDIRETHVTNTERYVSYRVMSLIKSGHCTRKEAFPRRDIHLFT